MKVEINSHIMNTYIKYYDKRIYQIVRNNETIRNFKIRHRVKEQCQSNYTKHEIDIYVLLELK